MLIFQESQQFSEELEKQKVARLKFLLEQTTLYSTFLSQKLQSAAEVLYMHVVTLSSGNEATRQPSGYWKWKCRRG